MSCAPYVFHISRANSVRHANARAHGKSHKYVEYEVCESRCTANSGKSQLTLKASNNHKVCRIVKLLKHTRKHERYAKQHYTLKICKY